jgi:hypothetical protein
MKQTQVARDWLPIILPIAFVNFAVAVSTIAADPVDAAAPSGPTVGALPACKGTPVETQKEAVKLIKTDVCTDALELLTGVQTGKQIGQDIQGVYDDIESDLSVKPICAASLMADFVQQLITGKLSVGFCPSGG